MGACARNMQSDPAEIKPAQCCIKLVFHLTYTMMHGSAKLKFNYKVLSYCWLYRVSLSLEAPNYCLCIQSNSAGFSFVNTGKQVHVKHARRHFETEFGERRAPSNCCIQKLIKKLGTRGSRSNACRLLSLGSVEGQSVHKYTPHSRTTQRRYTPRDSSRRHWHFGESILEFGETHSSVLGCERRPVSASIMSRSCFTSFPVCVYKLSSHYLSNIIFYRQ